MTKPQRLFTGVVRDFVRKTKNFYLFLFYDFLPKTKTNIFFIFNKKGFFSLPQHFLGTMSQE
jgi:hypothetical protein